MGGDVKIMQERKQHVFMTSVEGDSSRGSEVDVELCVDSVAVLIDLLNECKGTGKK